MKKAIFNFARFIFGTGVCVLLVASGMYALGAPADLPMWRVIIGMALWAAAALVFEKFVDTGGHAPKT